MADDRHSASNPPTDPSTDPSTDPESFVFESGRPERRFRVGRLLAVIAGVIVVLGLVAAVVDIVVLCGFLPQYFCLAPR